MTVLPDAFFLPTRRGSLFCLYHAPQGPVVRGRVLHLHSFAEELNTCRRISAQFARALAKSGYAVLQFDMYGCGDSEGEFGDATCANWLDNAFDALAELNRRASEDANANGCPLWFWGVRSGALLCAYMLKNMNTPCHLLWWQPVVSGQQVLQQWLRLDAAKAWLTQDKSSKRLSPGELLKQGETVHVAGYAIAAAMAEGLTTLELKPKAPACSAGARILWMELTSSSSEALPPAVTRNAATWESRGWDVAVQAMNTPPFWQEFGDTNAQALVEASLASMAQQG